MSDFVNTIEATHRAAEFAKDETQVFDARLASLVVGNTATVIETLTPAQYVDLPDEARTAIDSLVMAVNRTRGMVPVLREHRSRRPEESFFDQIKRVQIVEPLHDLHRLLNESGRLTTDFDFRSNVRAVMTLADKAFEAVVASPVVTNSNILEAVSTGLSSNAMEAAAIANALADWPTVQA